MTNEEKLASAVCVLEDKVESQLRTEWEKYYQQFKIRHHGPFLHDTILYAHVE